MLRIFWIALVSCCSVHVSAVCFAQDGRAASTVAELRAEALASMKEAASFFRKNVATHGGYVYFYDLELKQRWGEGEATPDQIWVQPPGTPAVGLAYLSAFDATGDAYYLSCVQEVAEALIYGQLKSGGWTNCIDFDPQGAQVAEYRNGNGRGKNHSSLDDGQTQTAIEFMVRADKALGFKNAAVHDSASVALAALLAAQFPCGAFPQVWTGPVAKHPGRQANYPEYDWRTEGRIKNYWDLYTLNDNLAVTTKNALLAAHEVYGEERYLNAVKRLGDFLIMSQMPEPQAGWAQQYNYAMQPAWARRFEPPAVCGHESQAIVSLLMEIYLATADEKYLTPIPAAIRFLENSELRDGTIARYYELQTNRPLFMEVNAGVYTLTYSDSNLPSHYSWKTKSQVKKLQRDFASVRERLGKSAVSVSVDGLAARARRIVDELDESGRWLSTSDGTKMVGQRRFPEGEQFLSSDLFIENLQTLAQFIQATGS
jgi:PelA/Pel-15E family pectate lyase